MRRLIDSALDGRPLTPATMPDEDELLAILAERARSGNVSAIKALLAGKDS